jgi:hypothetical protein
MSFDKLNATELRKVVENFVGETEAKDAKNKNELLAILADEGVSFSMYQSLSKSDKADPEEVLAPRSQAQDPTKVDVDNLDHQVVLKMERENGTFQAYGITFTKDHPFAVVSEEQANQICTTFQGFRPALPMELKEYYG